MNKLAIWVLLLFWATGCSKASDYVSDFIAEITEEKVVPQKVVPNLCPADKPTAKIIEGDCEGDWSFSYDAASKVYTCRYKHTQVVTCPAGTVSIGQPSACTGQVDQHTKLTVASNSKCDDLFKSQVKISYRLVCCI